MVYIEEPQFEVYLLEEAPLYDRILEFYEMSGSVEKAAKFYEKFMKVGGFDNLSNMSVSDAFMIQTMWRVHLLHPKTYQADCERCYGTLLIPRYITDGALLPGGLKNDVTDTCHTNMFCSMNLVDGMKRQLEFMSLISNMNAFRDAQYCQDSIKRYKLFLKLIEMTKCKAVPTLDIDLAWHTHMLFPGTYIRDTKEMIGYTPDHDDDVPSQSLKLFRDKTEALWNETFEGESYYSTVGGEGNCGLKCKDTCTVNCIPQSLCKSS